MSDMLTAESQSPALFTATLSNVKYLATLLRTIYCKEKLLCYVTPNGLKFSTGDAVTQAILYLQNSIFRTYTFNPPQPLEASQDENASYQFKETVFSVDFQTLLDCLNIFGNAFINPTGLQGQTIENMANNPSSTPWNTFSNKEKDNGATNVKMSMKDTGSALEIMLQENTTVTTCKLTCFEPEELLDFEFSSHPIVHKIIMKSEWLHQAFTELDSTCEFITISVSPQSPYLKLATSGVAGTTEISYPPSTDVITSFHCTHPTTNRYQFSSLAQCLRVLAISSKTSVRTNSRGFLSFQFMVVVREGEVCFVEFVVAPLEEDVEE
ncbi:Rad1/Rec1/Rad17 [Paraphysoderma sedebokerense]|nr:Rad1/Rec1/Rad17 [Paraphysoderma sedebokerense]